MQLRVLTHSALVAHAVQLSLLTHSALTTHAVQLRVLTHSALTAHAVHVRLLALRSPPQGLPSISLRSTHRGMNGAAGVAPADSDLPSKSVGLQTSQHGAEQQRALDPDTDGAAVFDALESALESVMESAELDDSVC